MGKYNAAAQILTTLLVLASSVRWEKLPEGKYRVEAIFAATANSPRQARTALFTSHKQAEVAYWHYLLEKTPLSVPDKSDAASSPSSTR